MVRSACRRCIFSRRRTLNQHLGLLHSSRMLIAPAFTWPSVNIVGPFKIKCVCGSNHRAAAKGWILVIRCPSTNAVSAKVMETLSTASATDAYSHHASRYGHIQHITSDQGSQFRSLWKSGKFSHVDLTLRLQSEYQQGGSGSQWSLREITPPTAWRSEPSKQSDKCWEKCLLAEHSQFFSSKLLSTSCVTQSLGYPLLFTRLVWATWIPSSSAPTGCCWGTPTGVRSLLWSEPET